MQEKDLYWFVGIFEGEGTFTFSNGKPKRLAVSMTDKDVLDRVREVVGGTVTPIAKRKSHYKDAWIWCIFGEDSVELAKKMLPLLGVRRAARCDEYINKFVTNTQRRRLQQIDKSKLLAEIRLLRIEGLTHRAIADRLGYERSYISRLLNSDMVPLV